MNGFKRVMMEGYEGGPETFEDAKETPIDPSVSYHIRDENIAALKSIFERDVIQPAITLLGLG